MIIGFLPLDSRPCTYDFPVQLAKQAGAQVILPPKGFIAEYKDVSDTARNLQWLKEIAPQCDALVISAEQLLHGGLIPSRKARMSADDQLAILQEIERIKKASPELQIFLSTVLMRTSISTLSEETRIWWEKVNVYSRLRYRVLTGADEKTQQQYDQLAQEIPQHVLESFLTAREVNHQINRTCIQLVAKNVVDELLILQEDCAPEGIHWLEQRVLLDDIEKNRLNDRVFLFNGTDEAGAELIQRALRPEGTSVEVVWLASQTDFVAKYEDRPFYLNLNGHMKALNMKQCQGADSVLCILPPKMQQGEATQPRIGNSCDYTTAELKQISEKIAELTKQGRHCYLLDLDFANGGNTELLDTLGQCMPISQLWGYAAWNTASNSLGTLLAQILASRYNTAANQAFTAERILDDGIYQTLVRSEVTKRLQEIGEDTYQISDTYRAEQYLMEAFCNRRQLLERIFGGKAPEFEVKLRWNRLFEAAVFVCGNGPIYQKS